jgi:hypothetical protein
LSSRSTLFDVKLASRQGAQLAETVRWFTPKHGGLPRGPSASQLEHDLEKAWPGPDPGWVPVLTMISGRRCIPATHFEKLNSLQLLSARDHNLI